MDSHVLIALALVHDGDRLLIARRNADAHLPNLWEFPGGKRRATESMEDCVVREVREELGIEIKVTATRSPLRYSYPDRQVELHPFDCEWLSGEPRPLGCAECRWVKLEKLCQYEFPAANTRLLRDLAPEI